MSASKMSIETSIIIRTLNEAKHLEQLLAGIREQNYPDWEVILVDSGSTDGTLDIARKYGASIHHIEQEQFTFGRSLNRGCEQANGKYLVFASGHVWPVNNNWLRSLVSPFEEPLVAMVYGRQRGTQANSLSELRDLQLNYSSTSHILVDEPNGNNGNAAVRSDLWLKQGFDESLPGLEDIDWARKMQRKGYRVYYAADAAVYHVHEESMRQVYRRYLREAIARKRMFPGSRFSGTDLAKGVSYAVIRDLFYALRHRTPTKVFQIPGTRLAEFTGTYRGMNYEKRLNGDIVRRLEVPRSCKSVVIDGPDRHSLRETAVPQAGPDEVIIQVAYVGVCATDLEVASGSLEYYKKGMATYPIVPGHEYSGIVVNKGAQAGHLKTGQKVVGECAIGCGDCAACAVGHYYRCPGRREVGVINMDGAYSRYLVLPSRYVHRVPMEVPLKHAAIVEPLAVCLKGLNKLEVAEGSRACVVGAGSIGNLCSQILKTRGLRVTCVDRDPRRLDLLHKYDMDTLTEPKDLDRYDYLIEASGNEDVLPRLIEESRPSARILLLGLPYTRPVTAAYSTVTSYDKEIYGSVASQSVNWEEAIRLVRAGTINLEDHTAMVEPFEDYEKVWEGVRAREYFKVVLSVSPDLEGL